MWTSTSHTLHHLSEEVLFGYFILALNSVFAQQLSLADEGYESGSNKDLLTPLCTATHIHHVSSMEHASFDPAHTTPCHPADTTRYDTQHSPLRPVHHCLSFSSDQVHDTSPVCMDTSDSSRDATPEPSNDEDSSNEVEDFQTVPMDDEHWTTEMVPVRTFCIHENGYPITCAHTHVLMELMALPHT